MECIIKNGVRVYQPSDDDIQFKGNFTFVFANLSAILRSASEYLHHINDYNEARSKENGSLLAPTYKYAASKRNNS